MNGKTSFKQKIRQAKGKKGFTLVELVIVIAVLAIIAFIAIPTVTNVISNANTSADMSNAQAVETAIKTAQSECAANATTYSERADKVINQAADSRTLTVLLNAYGVDPNVLTKPKVTGDQFYYNTKNGKVIASSTAPTGADSADYKAITASTAYTSSQTSTSSKDVPLSSDIAIKFT